ncbi:MAG: hypothetical protein AAGF95_24765 [Chloroflexota bacterium]
MILLLSRCGVTSANGDPQLIQTDTFEGVIFDSHMAQERSMPYFLDNVDDYWVPTPDDVMQVEAGLADYLQQNAQPEYTRLRQHLSEYKRQYVGIIQNGQPSIYVNCVCIEFSNWENSFNVVIEGGDCFFQLQYDVENKRYFNLQVYGAA